MYFLDTTNKNGNDIINPISACFGLFQNTPIQDNDKIK